MKMETVELLCHTYYVLKILSASTSSAFKFNFLTSFLHLKINQQSNGCD